MSLYEKNPNLGIVVQKKTVLIDGDNIVTTFETNMKVYKTKPNLKSMKNRTVKKA